MRTPLSVSLAIFCSCLASAAFAQTIDVPDQARLEIERRGSFVERIHTADDLHAAGQNVDPSALEPPADDSHKWFISVLSQPGCGPCTQLKRDFARSEFLQAFVNVENHKQSWAHYNVYNVRDETQRFRFAKLKITGTPTVIIQPPRSGEYGDPATVVMQLTGYDGDARAMALRIRNAIVTYAARVKNQTPRRDAEADAAEGFGQQPPFNVPSVDPLVPPQLEFPRPFQPQPQPQPLQPGPYPQPGGPLFPNMPNLIQPLQPQLDIGSLISMLLGGMLGGLVTPTNILLVAGGLYAIREIRKARGKEPILKDESFSRLIELLQGMLSTTPPQKTPKTPEPQDEK